MVMPSQDSACLHLIDFTSDCYFGEGDRTTMLRMARRGPGGKLHRTPINRAFMSKW
jgi:hypothetical protein